MILAFCCIFILLSLESDQCAIRVRLEVVSHLSTIPRLTIRPRFGGHVLLFDQTICPPRTPKNAQMSSFPAL